MTPVAEEHRSHARFEYVEALLARAVLAALRDDPARARVLFTPLLRRPLGTPEREWARWGVAAALAAEQLWSDPAADLARPGRDAAAPGTVVAQMDPADELEGWQHDGGGNAAPGGATLNVVGLAGEHLRFTATCPELENGRGTWAEFVVSRRSSIDGDTRLELADGSVREVVFVDPGSVRLGSGSFSAELGTSLHHIFGLWVKGQTSRLYVDGQLLLESRGLPSDTAREVTFGAYPHPGTGDTESSWRLVRVVRASAEPAGAAGFMPAPWPAAVVIRVADGLVAEGRWRRALALLVAARREQPADTTIGDRLKQVFEEAQRQGARPQQLRQAHRQLPLSDRRLWGVEGGDSATAAPLVSVRNISVRFGEPRTQLAGRRLRSLFGGARPSAAGEVWAVRDVSFELRPGELLGIIGRNGAGKSTLLNVLADQVAPSSGDAIVNGRRLLLTQGLGFLPGLTGRENLILGGLYLGLRRSEVERRFEEMVEFAELWDAIDRPLRTYSSGMRSRLQFALATAVEPDILLLDELLGAGDAAFVEKAQARMQRTLERARAVIVVTHDMGFVAASCTQAIVLEGGEVAFQGDPENAVACYVDILAQRPKRVERGPGE